MPGLSLNFLPLIIGERATKMAQQVKALVLKSDKPSLIPRTHGKWKESARSTELPADLHTRTAACATSIACVGIHPHTIINGFEKPVLRPVAWVCLVCVRNEVLPYCLVLQGVVSLTFPRIDQCLVL